MVVVTLPVLYAHRLGCEPGPDSSRAALQAMLAGRVDGVETDACLTADGRLVLLHDPVAEQLHDDVARLGAPDGGALPLIVSRLLPTGCRVVNRTTWPTERRVVRPGLVVRAQQLAGRRGPNSHERISQFSRAVSWGRGLGQLIPRRAGSTGDEPAARNESAEARAGGRAEQTSFECWFT